LSNWHTETTHSAGDMLNSISRIMFKEVDPLKLGVLGFGGLLFVVIFALIAPQAKVSGAWWVLLIATWMLCPPQRALPPNTTEWTPTQAMAFPVFAWLFFQAHLFSMDALRTWTVFDHSPFLRAYTVPLQVTLGGILATALLSLPLQRLYGQKGSIAAGLVVLPYFVWAISKLFLVRQGSHHLLRDLFLLYNASIPSLLFLGTQALLVRAHRRPISELSVWQARLKLLLTGQAPLRETFFKVFLPVLLLSLLTIKLRFRGTPGTGLPAELSAGISALIPLSTLILTVAALLLWKAVYRSKSRPISPVFAGAAAMFGLAPLWIWTLTIDGPLTDAYLREAIQRLPGPAYLVQCSSGKKAIRVEGEYQSGVARVFEQELSRCPSAQVVQLGGPGGKLAEGIALAKTIKEKGLSTIVPEVCVSACTVAFMAGKHRVVLSNQALGFHSVLSPSIVGADHQSYSEFMAKQGVPEWFVEKAIQTPHYTAWYPSNEELVKAGVVTHLVSSDGNNGGILRAHKVPELASPEK
jgi:hypothetical protein